MILDLAPSRALAALFLALAACAQEKPADTQFHGMVLTQARAKPAFTFTTTSGAPYRFREETAGRLTLLFFGYTHCPDVCPLHMANIAAVTKKLSYADRERIRVVFVTTDPERDTPERLRTWLANFDPSFVGVAGQMNQINGLQRSLGLAPASPESAPPGSPAGAYGVAHSALVLAFTPDDSLRVMYPFGTRQQDWAKDIPELLKVGTRG